VRECTKEPHINRRGSTESAEEGEAGEKGGARAPSCWTEKRPTFSHVSGKSGPAASHTDSAGMSEVARGRGGRGASSVGQSVDVGREHPCNGCHRSVVRRRDMHQQRQPALGTIPLAEGGDFGVGRGDEGSGGSRRRRRRAGGGGLLAVAVVALAACCPTAFG